jgi:hypothetical protein
MDQLRTFLAAAQRHSFWVMCVVILMVSIGSWWYSTSQLAQTREAQKAKIKTVMDGLDKLKKNNPLHPNEASNLGMDGLITAYSLEVAKGWESQYNRQASVLVWPESFGDDFKGAVDDLRPIEKLTYPTPIRDEIEVAYRRVYRNFIEEELPNLADIIGTEWTASSAASSGGSGGSGMSGSGSGAMRSMPPTGGSYPSPGSGSGGMNGMNEVVDTSIVAWPRARQQELFDTHFGFCAREDAPTTLEVLYAQEDIWVLTSLMNIIAETNEGAEARHDAAIKEIDFIRLGREAIGFVGEVTKIGTPKSSGVVGSGGYPDSTMPTTAPGAGPMPTTSYSADGSGMPGAGVSLNDPAEGRYVDAQFNPLPAAKIRESLTSVNPEDALLAVAKRMPIRMRFTMDQRKLNRLLAECGNSKLPLEVRQVRVNRPEGQVSSGGSSGGGMRSSGGYGMPSSAPAPMLRSSSPSSGGMDYSSMPGSGGGARGLISDATVDNNAIPVEIYGVVYIYNPVNKTQLGIVEEPEATAGPTTTTLPVTPTAATPATATPTTTPAPVN